MPWPASRRFRFVTQPDARVTHRGLAGGFLGAIRRDSLSISMAILATTKSLLAHAPADAMQRITPEQADAASWRSEASIARLAGDMAAAKLDALIVVGDDQEELFDQDNMPAIGIYYGETIRNAGQERSRATIGWRGRGGVPGASGGSRIPLSPRPGAAPDRGAATDGFDMSVMRARTEGQREGHAYSFVHRFCIQRGAVPIVPVFLNAYYPPNQPSPARCFALGDALRRAVEAFPPGRAHRHHGVRRVEPFRGGRSVRSCADRCIASEGRRVLS